MFTRSLLACFLLAFLLWNASAHAAEKRVALIIGNGAYANAPALANPRNDAEDMAAALRKLGFTVILGLDLDKTTMDRKIRAFAKELSGADAGVFHYSGHGLQVAGVNYLVPVDAELATESALDFEAVRLDLIQRTMEREARTNIIFLDACRNNPFTRVLARSLGTRAVAGGGLAPAESGVGTLISFSTQPGNVAVDGAGRTSPYSGALAKALGKPGEDILSVLTAVRNEVLAATNEKQVPWENHALRAKFYFNPSGPAPAGEAPPPAKERAPVRLVAKSGEKIDLFAVWYTNKCKSKLIATPEVEVLEGPPEVRLSVREDMVTPRDCPDKIKGGFVVATIGPVKAPVEARVTFRVKYKTKDGTRQFGHVYNVSLFP